MNKNLQKAGFIFAATAGVTGVAAGVAIPTLAAATAQAVIANGTVLKVTVKAATTLNVRTAPNTSGSIVGTVKTGDTFTGVYTNQWLHITSGVYTGKYVSASSLTTWYNYAVVSTPTTSSVKSTTSTTTTVKPTSSTTTTVKTVSPTSTPKPTVTTSKPTSTTVSPKPTITSVSPKPTATPTTTKSSPTPKPTATTPTPKPTPKPSTVGVTKTFKVLPIWYPVKVRSAPSITASIVGTLKPSTVFTAVDNGADNDWVKTNQGYVNKGVLDLKGDAKNGVSNTLTLCTYSTSFNTVGNVSPSYTPSTARYLNCYAAHQLNALEKAYQNSTGHVAQIDLGFRSLAEQQYWYNKFGYPRAAIPGTSNHGWGLAVDFSDSSGSGKEFNWGGPGWTWLSKNAPTYGWTEHFAYGTTGESYHWDFLG